jgi:hypothetical protein
MGPDGKVESLVDNYRGGRFNRPNDLICHSSGCLYFTDPDKRRPYHEREIPGPSGEDNLWDGGSFITRRCAWNWEDKAFRLLCSLVSYDIPQDTNYC